jgi:hypothetical protein
MKKLVVLVLLTGICIALSPQEIEGTWFLHSMYMDEHQLYFQAPDRSGGILVANKMVISTDGDELTIEMMPRLPHNVPYNADGEQPQLQSKWVYQWNGERLVGEKSRQRTVKLASSSDGFSLEFRHKTGKLLYKENWQIRADHKVLVREVQWMDDRKPCYSPSLIVDAKGLQRTKKGCVEGTVMRYLFTRE